MFTAERVNHLIKICVKKLSPGLNRLDAKGSSLQLYYYYYYYYYYLDDLYSAVRTTLIEDKGAFTIS